MCSLSLQTRLVVHDDAMDLASVGLLLVFGANRRVEPTPPLRCWCL